MSIEELRRRRSELSARSEKTLSNMNIITEESRRVADVAHNSQKILKNLDKEFEVQTGLNGTDITFLFFASTALAFVFSRLTGALSWGFLIVGGIYLLLGALIWLLKDRLLQLPIMNALLRQFFTDDDDYEDE